MSEGERFGSGDAVFVVDARLRIIEWNATAEALTGIGRRAAIGRHCWEVLRGQSDEEDEVCRAGCRLAQRALGDGDVAGRPMVITTASGTRRIWMTTVAARADGRARILHVLSRNVPPRQSAELTGLTDREREVLSLLGEGLDASTIARRLGITVTTVRTHIRHILSTLGVHSQLAAVTSTCGQAQSSDCDPDTQL